MKLIATLLALSVAITGLAWYMTAMPGISSMQTVPSLSPEDSAMRDRLRHHVDVIAQQEHNVMTMPALEAVALYLETSLKESGFEVATQTYPVSLGTVRNIEVEIRGRSRADEIILIGAHYDSVYGSPGANDNGSGVAAVLELARWAKSRQPEHTWRFVLFVNEEPPYFKTELMGSRVYAKRAKQKNEKIVAMYSLETIGYFSDQADSQHYPFPLNWFYPDRGNFIALVSNFASRKLLRQSLAAFRENAALPSEGIAAPGFITGIDWSDHWSFWEENYPALMVTDTAPFRYPFYHTPQDTPDKLDYTRLTLVVSGFGMMLARLDREL